MGLFLCQGSPFDAMGSRNQCRPARAVLSQRASGEPRRRRRREPAERCAASASSPGRLGRRNTAEARTGSSCRGENGPPPSVALETRPARCRRPDREIAPDRRAPGSLQALQQLDCGDRRESRLHRAMTANRCRAQSSLVSKRGSSGSKSNSLQSRFPQQRTADRDLHRPV